MLLLGQRQVPAPSGPSGRAGAVISRPAPTQQPLLCSWRQKRGLEICLEVWLINTLPKAFIK